MVFRKIISDESEKTRGDLSLLLGVYFALAQALRESKHFPGAIIWYKKFLLSFKKISGWRYRDLSDLMYACEKLGLCCENLSKFENILVLYRKAWEKLEHNYPNGVAKINQFKGRVFQIQERMKASIARTEEDDEFQ